MIGGILLIVFAVIIYFLPWGVASYRDHSNSRAIFWLNLLTGWSFIGWVAALVWACLNQGEPKEAMKTCPHCAESIKAAALVCRYCNKDVATTTGTKSKFLQFEGGTAVGFNDEQIDYYANVMAAQYPRHTALGIAVTCSETINGYASEMPEEWGAKFKTRFEEALHLAKGK